MALVLLQGRPRSPSRALWLSVKGYAKSYKKVKSDKLEKELSDQAGSLILDIHKNFKNDEYTEQRRQTLLRVRKAVKSGFGNDYSVQLFGSSRYGVFSRQSDLDMVVLDSRRMTGFSPKSPKKLPGIYQIGLLAAELKRAGFKIIAKLPNAKVPIVKFKDPRTGFHCDINVNERLGLYNSSMISRYCDLSPLLRPMLAYIKAWAKPLGLNNPAVAGAPVTFSSYAFALMTIYYLQTRGLLPNLQADLGPLPSRPGRRDVFWLRKPKLMCDVRYHEGKEWAHPEEFNAANIMENWFLFWGIEFDYSHAVNIRTSGLRIQGENEPKSIQPILTPSECSPQTQHDVDEITDETLPTQPQKVETSQVMVEGKDTCGLPEATQSQKANSPSKKTLLRVMDPFILSKNVTLNIGNDSLRRFRIECIRAAEAGVQVRDDDDDILKVGDWDDDILELDDWDDSLATELSLLRGK